MRIVTAFHPVRVQSGGVCGCSWPSQTRDSIITDLRPQSVIEILPIWYNRGQQPNYQTNSMVFWHNLNALQLTYGSKFNPQYTLTVQELLLVNDVTDQWRHWSMTSLVNDVNDQWRHILMTSSINDVNSPWRQCPHRQLCTWGQTVASTHHVIAPSSKSRSSESNRKPPSRWQQLRCLGEKNLCKRNHFSTEIHTRTLIYHIVLN